MDNLALVVCRLCRRTILRGEGRWLFYDYVYRDGITYCITCCALNSEALIRESRKSLHRWRVGAEELAAETAKPTEVKPEE